MRLNEFVIGRTWDGDPVDRNERVVLALDSGPRGLEISIDAPFHDDPAPAVPAGRCEGLWEFEVVELFLVGENQRYLELEFGPHGHFLALQLAGARQVVGTPLAIDYRSSIQGRRWNGTAQLAAEHIPHRLGRWNAFAIHGSAGDRRYLAAHPLSGSKPDFHRIDRFPKVAVAASIFP